MLSVDKWFWVARAVAIFNVVVWLAAAVVYLLTAWELWKRGRR